MIKYAIIFLTIIYLTSAEDYYDLLGVSKSADQREIRKAFKTIAVTHHPDKNKDDPKAHEKFIKLTTAYEVLKDPELRKKYDLYGEEGFENINKKPNYHSWNYYKYNFGIYDDDPQVVTLNRNDYFENVFNSEKMWLVNFYSPMCHFCHHLAPIWRKLAEEFEGVIKVGAVNCEDDFQLCQQIGITGYPALLYIAKNSTSGRQYTGERTHNAIKDFILNKLYINIPEISLSNWKRLIKNNELIKKPMLVFTYKNKEECLSSDDLLKVAAIFDKTLNIQLLHCKENECDDISDNTCAIFLPTISDKQTWVPIYLKNIENVKDLIEQVLEQLPEPKNLTDNEFEEIRRELRKEAGIGWLVCFYIGHSTELDLILKKLPNVINTINLGKINCGRYGYLCNTLDVNRYPMWGVLKPGGAFELSHGKNTIHDIAKFTTSSIKANNLWALSADKVLSILQRNSGKEVWFLDWFAPWCPPCMQFLPELRKASMQFNKSVVHFGTIDCTVHSSICRKYNIRSYPTAMLINGTKTYQFTAHKTATNVIQFINDIRNPSVIQLSANNFNQYLEKDKDKTIWIVDYFVGWCAPCQHLAPEWTAVAKILNILPFVKVANVDCEVENNLCRLQEVGSYPNIRLYPRDRKNLNKAIKYDGPHKMWHMLKWISTYFPTKVYDLDPSSLRKKVFSGKNVWLVDFYAPWCDHCQKLDPHISVTAQLFSNKVNFGKFNCEQYHTQCSQAGVKAYPTLIIYDRKHDIKDVDKGFQIMATSSEMIKEKLSNYLNTNKKNKRDEL
ncbi:PREDICTED: dnaJ homolog subfamily C member 10-like [Polistes canadensis]|uniref:dnaJ homolog subfamily C member 10-like n=1 Tax=Polistes canadensis TaxID=91411 RepID=UPI000718F0AB|nr:PREDICTED: dnaJ homolog subfamily C member 10-like [Polistes canadensis]XP_014614551.1 PREDICTED: dnaJ homolog subfamily C member 10-like [Polistes canadensis]